MSEEKKVYGDVKKAVAELAAAHWGYVRQVLEAHGESELVIEKCGMLYVLGFAIGHNEKIENAEKLAIILWKPYSDFLRDIDIEKAEIIEKCRFHFVTAFIHGHKHAMEEKQSES